MKMNSAILLLTGLMIGGCANDNYALRLRVESLESQVAALEAAQGKLADASIENSNSIKENAESMEIIVHALGKK